MLSARRLWDMGENIVFSPYKLLNGVFYISWTILISVSYEDIQKVLKLKLSYNVFLHQWQSFKIFPLTETVFTIWDPWPTRRVVYLCYTLIHSTANNVSVNEEAPRNHLFSVKEGGSSHNDPSCEYGGCCICMTCLSWWHCCTVLLLYADACHG